MRYVQLVLTDSQALLNAQALANAIQQNDDAVEREQLRYLADFFRAVAENPAAFPVKTKAMARSIKKRASRMRAQA
jgi:hypothetical protein